MTRPEATREDVLQTIEEFDHLGRDEFLAKYRANGLGPARDYFIRHAGSFYDSKVVLAAAHERSTGRPLHASEFSGGDAAAAEILRRLGFTVTSPSPDWREDEIVLACDLVYRNDWRYLSSSRPEVVELSALLQEFSDHPVALRGPRFRNPNGVARKTADIATQHPAFSGRSTRGNRLDKQVLEEFLADPAVMSRRADALRGAINNDSSQVQVPDMDLDWAVAGEGRLLEKLHLVRERNPVLRQKKIDQVAARGEAILCEVCKFDFAATYGEQGRGYIEVHHRTPLHATGPTRTTMADLALLCSNCHRMIHRKSPWLQVGELAEMFEKARERLA